MTRFPTSRLPQRAARDALMYFSGHGSRGTCALVHLRLPELLQTRRVAVLPLQVDVRSLSGLLPSLDKPRLRKQAGSIC